MSEPVAPRLLLESARRAARQGRKEQALGLLRRAYEAKPEPRLARRLVRLQQELGNSGGALEFLRAAARRFPDDFLLNHLLARASQQRGDFDAYERCALRMQQAAAEDPALAEKEQFWPFLTDAQEYRGGYLFVSGAARSGTTALGEVLNLSQDVAVLVERYRYFYGYAPAMFARERLGQLSGPHEPANRRLLERYGTARLLGDKTPNFALSLRMTMRRLRPDAVRIVHIVRDPAEVGLSYDARADNELDRWPRDRDFSAAMNELNWNNREMLRALERPEWKASIRVVEYAELWRSVERALAIFDWLGVAIAGEARSRLALVYEESAAVAKKNRKLGADHERVLAERFDFAAHRQLLKHAA